jgi:hypothetical protein
MLLVSPTKRQKRRNDLVHNMTRLLVQNDSSSIPYSRLVGPLVQATLLMMCQLFDSFLVVVFSLKVRNLPSERPTGCRHLVPRNQQLFLQFGLDF